VFVLHPKDNHLGSEGDPSPLRGGVDSRRLSRFSNYLSVTASPAGSDGMTENELLSHTP
jgi:hypothetical protein